MIVRKLFVVCAILASLFPFEGSLAYSMPRESTRIEVVIEKAHAEIYNVRKPRLNKVVKRVIQETLQKQQVLSPHFHSLLISSIYFHSAL